MKRIITLAMLLVVVTLSSAACGQSDADVASQNLSTAAEQFKVARDIVGINGFTDKYLWEVRGYCSVETSNSGLAGALEVTCKIADNKYKKLFFGLADNVTYVVRQIDAIDVSVTRYKVIFKPSTVVPDIDLK